MTELSYWRLSYFIPSVLFSVCIFVCLFDNIVFLSYCILSVSSLYVNYFAPLDSLFLFKNNKFCKILFFHVKCYVVGKQFLLEWSPNHKRERERVSAVYSHLLTVGPGRQMSDVSDVGGISFVYIFSLSFPFPLAGDWTHWAVLSAVCQIRQQCHTVCPQSLVH